MTGGSPLSALSALGSSGEDTPAGDPTETSPTEPTPTEPTPTEPTPTEPTPTEPTPTEPTPTEPEPSGPDSSACAKTGHETVATDKEDYAPGETVQITGDGYTASCDVVVKVTRPDGSVVKGDGSFEPGSDTVTTDANGDLAYEYILNGIEGEYLIEVLGADDVVLASMTFTDALTFVQANLDLSPAFVLKPTSTTAATQTFSLLVEQASDTAMKCIRLVLPAGWTINSAAMSNVSAGTWSSAAISGTSAKFVSADGLPGSSSGFARIEVNATTPTTDGTGSWLIQVSTSETNAVANMNCAGTLLSQNVATVWDDVWPGGGARIYTADFRDSGGAATTPSVTIGDSATYRMRVTLTGTAAAADDRMSYATIALPPCFGSISISSTTAFSPAVTRLWTGTVLDNVIRLRSNGPGNELLDETPDNYVQVVFTATATNACSAGSSTWTTSAWGNGTARTSSAVISRVFGITGSHPTMTLLPADSTPPAVVSINRSGGDPTNAASVGWDVEFSEPVTGVDATDFALANTGLGGSPAITGVTMIDGDSYTVTASTGSGSGTLGLNLNDNDSIVDGVGNKLGGTGTGVAGGGGAGNGSFTGQVYAIDRSPPTVTLDLQADSDSGSSSSDNLTNATTLRYDVTFSETVTSSVGLGDFGTSGGATGCTVANLLGTGAAYTVDVTGCGNGTVTLTFAANGATDAAGNTGPTSASSAPEVTIDRTAPTVTLDLQAGSDSGSSSSDNLTNATTLRYDVSFSESVTNSVALGDFGTSGGATGCTVANLLGTGAAYTVDVTGCGNGTVTLTFAANGATDAAGNTGPTSASSAPEVTIDRTAPSVTINSASPNPVVVPISGPTQNLTVAWKADETGAYKVTLGTCAVAAVNSGATNTSGAYDTADSVITTTIPAGSLAYGSNTIRVCVKDAAGNEGSSTRSVDKKAATSLLYNGDQMVVLGNSFNLRAQLTSALASCVTGRTISYSLDDNPTTPVPDGPHALGSGTTAASATGSGPFSAATGNSSTPTSGWNPGVYVITASVASTAQCVQAQDEATLTVASLGDAATGGGFLAGSYASGSGRFNFGFTVQKVPNTIDQYKGQFVLVNNTKWRLKGTLSSYVKTNTSGASSGVGTLSRWNWALNGGLGGWEYVASNVSFTISFADNGGGKKGSPTKPDTFGIHIDYDASAYPDPLPRISPPQELKGGDISVR